VTLIQLETTFAVDDRRERNVEVRCECVFTFREVTWFGILAGCGKTGVASEICNPHYVESKADAP
jgi:hypothetical protein